LYRALDQLYSICQGNGRMIIIGERAGLSQGKHGSAHQSVGQPGALLNMPNLIFLEPADVEDLFNCYNYAFSKYPGPVYIRLHSEIIENLPSEEPKNINNYIVMDSKGKPHINIVGSGLAMTYAVDAIKNLEISGINARLINIVNPKTLDEKFVSRLHANVPILTLYNGNPFVLESSVASICMRQPNFISKGIYSQGFISGTSGPVKDLLTYFGYDVKGIESKVKEILR
jgi:transketolase